MISSHAAHGLGEKHLFIGTFSRCGAEQIRCEMVFTGTQGTRDAAHKYGLPGVQRLRSVHHKVTVVQVPGADLDLSHTHIHTHAGFSSTDKLQLRKVDLKVTTASCYEFIKTLQWMCACVCTCVCTCVRAATDRLVFDGGAGHAEVQLAVLFDAGIDQSLHGAFILEQQEGVTCGKHSAVVYGARRGSHWNLVQQTLQLRV